ncbi:hypothetical protein CKO08_12550 [Halorhodospira halochloris]|nr:hypothetical protein [Halorhodospira halochloris]
MLPIVPYNPLSNQASKIGSFKIADLFVQYKPQKVKTMKTQPRYHPLNRNWRLHYEPTYQGLPVKCERHNHSPLVENFLEKTLTLFQRTREQHPRTFALRFDLYFPADFDLAAINHGSDIMKTFWRYLDSQFNAASLAHSPKTEYIWVREIGPQSDKPHFHVLLMLDANAILTLGNPAPSPDGTYSDNTLAHRIIRSWLGALAYPALDPLGSLVYFQKDPHTGEFIRWLLDRSDDYNWTRLFYLTSYLFKAYSKPVGQGIRAFGSSRLYRRTPA